MKVVFCLCTWSVYTSYNITLYVCHWEPNLKRESTRSWSDLWTETLYQHYLPCIVNFCATVLNIFLREIISNKTKCRKQMLKTFISNTWKCWWMHNFFELWNSFPSLLMGNCFWCYMYFRQRSISLITFISWNCLIS